MYSFKYVAPYSAALNVSMEETAAAIGILSDAGMKGTTAGTTLRGMFSRLAKPTEKAQEIMDELGITVYDNEGKFRSISDIIGIVTEKTSGLSEQEKNFALSTIFGQEALTGVLALMEVGPDKINELTNSYLNCDGAAKEMADTMMGNTKGAWDEFTSALENVSIAIGDVLLPHVTKAIKWITDMVRAFGDLDPAVQENIVKWGAIAAAIGPVLIIGGKFVGMIGTMVSALSSLGGVMEVLAGPIGWIALLGTAIAGLAIAWNKTQDELTENTGGFIEATNNLESFEGKIRTTDNWLTKLFGKEIEIKFSTNVEQEKEDVKKHYDFMIQDAQDFYKRKWDVDHDGCEDMEEHYKHMEEAEMAYRERMANRMLLNSDLDKEYERAQNEIGNFLVNEEGWDSLDAGDYQGKMLNWIQGHVDIVKEGEDEIERITREGIMARGQLTQQELDDIERIREEISGSRTIVYSSAEDQYNAFKAYHIKEGVLYDEKSERIKRNSKEFTTNMEKSKKTLADSYIERAEYHKREMEQTGYDLSRTIEMYEGKARAVQDFSDEYIRRTNDNIWAGQEYMEATSNAFASIVNDLYSGELAVEDYGLTTEEFLKVAMDSMIEGGASADELAEAIHRIPPDKRAQVKAYVEGKVDAEELKRAIDRLEGKTIKVTTQYQTQYLQSTGNQVMHGRGPVATQKATGTDYALPGLTEVAEYGSEIIATRNSAMLATGRQLINLAGGEKIYNARQTKDILDNMGKSSQIDYSDSLRIINSNIILLKEAIERKNFSNVVNNNIEKIDINEVANIEEIEYQLTEMMERRTYGGV